MGTSDTWMGSQAPIAIHFPPSEYAKVRVLRVARRAIRQLHRENVVMHQGMVDKVRATMTVDTQQTAHGTQKLQQRGTACAGPLWLALISIWQTARSGPFVLYCIQGIVGSFLAAYACVGRALPGAWVCGCLDISMLLASG